MVTPPTLTSPDRFPLPGAVADARFPPPSPDGFSPPWWRPRPDPLQADGPGPERGLACLGSRPWAVSALGARRVRHFWEPPAG